MRIWLGAAALVLATAGIANAQTSSAGFYVRGDLEAGFAQNLTFTDVDPGAANCDLCGARLPATIGTSIMFGGGIGYRFSPLLRGDVTVDDLPSLSVHGTTTQPGSPTGTAPLSLIVVLANGYLDLNGLYPGAFGRFEPYVTAGLGFARNDVGNFSGSFTVGPLAGVTFSEVGSVQTNFAWGVGAGVGYPLAPDLSLDIGYRYLDVGDVRSGTTETVLGVLQPPITASKSGDLGVHTLIASLRYGF
ncbi:MAG TPA: outer membrane beta-barrel protein [Stellaceae bacterium]|nr:outer membrane beta-barrel protein [Stellaceae bacterium]